MANVSSIKLPNNTTYNIVDKTSGYTKNTGTITKIQTTAGAHTTIDVSSGAATFNVPTKTSHLTNDSGFLISHQDISGKADKATTLSGYGITDAKIASGVITLGSNTITPLTSSSTLSAAKLSGAIPSAVTATTQASTDNSTKIATTAFVSNAIANIPDFVGATSSAVGTHGLVPAPPQIGELFALLFQDGIWADLYSDVTQSAAGITLYLSREFESGTDTLVTWRIPVASPTTAGILLPADSDKLAMIEPGAEVNQNAFSNVKVGSTTVAADSKTDTLELVAGSNITLTPDATNDKVTIASNCAKVQIVRW